MGWPEIRTSFLTSALIPEEIKSEPKPQCLADFLAEDLHAQRRKDFMLGAEAMYKYMLTIFGDDLR